MIMKVKLEKVSNTQINRIAKLDTRKSWHKQLSSKDVELVFSLAYVLAKKKGLTEEELEHWTLVAVTSIALESLRREGLVVKTKKGWKKTALGKKRANKT